MDTALLYACRFALRFVHLYDSKVCALSECACKKYKTLFSRVLGYLPDASTADFLVQKIYCGLDCVLGEINKRNLLYSSQISCQFSLIDIDKRRAYLRSTTHASNAELAAATATTVRRKSQR